MQSISDYLQGRPMYAIIKRASEENMPSIGIPAGIASPLAQSQHHCALWQHATPPKRRRLGGVGEIDAGCNAGGSGWMDDCRGGCILTGMECDCGDDQGEH